MKNCYSKKYFQERDLLVPHIAWAIKTFAVENNLKRILDVGCGTGKWVKFLNDNGFEAAGCDISSEAVKIARQYNKKGVIFQASATKLPFANSSFDLVIAISLIEHLTEDEGKKFILEAARFLKTGGFIFLITPNFATPLRLIQGRKWFAYRDPTHIHYYTPWGLAKLLRNSGFSNIKFNFRIKYEPSFDWEFPSFFSKFPKPLKYLLIYSFFSPPLSFLRNSFWIAAQKND